MKLTRLLTQNLDNPIGLGCTKPCFCYTLQSEERGSRQTACQILAASSPELLEEGRADLWDSGKMQEERNYAIPYEGAPLASRQEVFWKARVWDEKGNVSPWSGPASFEMGLLEEKDWKAAWIGQGDDFTGDKSAAPAIVGRFTVKARDRVKRARLYISGWAFYGGRQWKAAFRKPV